MTTAEKKTRTMPKGGRKGGSVFPRVAFKDALTYARKLVSKTHTNPQPRDVIHSGVFGAKGGIGQVRTSALRQYGLLMGDEKSHYSATELAKQISAAPHEELIQLYRQAVLKPAVFKKLFDTYHGDTVTKAKLKQRAADLRVHPDETESCVELYLSGMLTAGLVTIEGDRITHIVSSQVSTAMLTDSDLSEGDPDFAEEDALNSEAPEGKNNAVNDQNSSEPTATSGNGTGTNNGPPMSSLDPVQLRSRAVFNVNVTLDSSMDIEKLQKQLELLQRFGAI